MLGITTADWIVIAAYLLVITALGFWAARRVTSSTSLFIGDRKFGKVMMMFFTFGTGTHSDQAVSVAAKTYQSGASGIWYQWLWLFVTPFFWLLAPMFRRMRAVTTGDYFEARYDRGVAGLYAVVGTLQLMVNIGVMLKGSSVMITAVSGGAIDPHLAVLAMTFLFVLYGVVGGLSAAIVTDFVQGLLTIALSFLILPFALKAVNGMEGLREAIHDEAMFKIVAPEEITFFYIAVISFNALVGWVTQPQAMGISAAGRTEMEGRVGVMGGILFKRVCTIAWVLTGMCAIGLTVGQEVEADQVYGLMARRLLPGIAPGLVGLFIASMLAAVMSSCDAFMIASAALFTENVYKPLRPDRNDSHYLRVGRITSVAVVACGILVAFNLQSVVSGLEMFWKVAAMMAIPFWLGLFWRRATTAAAWAATFASFFMLLATSEVRIATTTIWDFNALFASSLPDLLLYDGTLHLPWQMLIYLTVGVATGIVVSLVTRPVATEKLNRFYACLRTPVEEGEPETTPFTLPPGIEPVPRNSWVDHPEWEVPRPTRTTLLGFVAGWIAVGSLIAAFYWILMP